MKEPNTPRWILVTRGVERQIPAFEQSNTELSTIFKYTNSAIVKWKYLDIGLQFAIFVMNREILRTPTRKISPRKDAEWSEESVDLIAANEPSTTPLRTLFLNAQPAAQTPSRFIPTPLR